MDVRRRWKPIFANLYQLVEDLFLCSKAATNKAEAQPPDSFKGL